MQVTRLENLVKANGVGYGRIIRGSDKHQEKLEYVPETFDPLQNAFYGPKWSREDGNGCTCAGCR